MPPEDDQQHIDDECDRLAEDDSEFRSILDSTAIASGPSGWRSIVFTIAGVVTGRVGGDRSGVVGGFE
jgi:hypothetical protein